jgi:hypothetical protein
MVRFESPRETNFTRHERWAVRFLDGGSLSISCHVQSKPLRRAQETLLSFPARPSGKGNEKGPSSSNPV